MKMLMILMLATLAATVSAQDAHIAAAVHPSITTRDLAASRFWTRSTIALAAVDGAAKVADNYVTRRNMDAGGAEYNPLARPFVHTTGVQVATAAAVFAAEIGVAYFMHRRHHDIMARGVLVGGTAVNGVGAAMSYKQRVKGW
jgi:hypothetical protein